MTSSRASSPDTPARGGSPQGGSPGGAAADGPDVDRSGLNAGLKPRHVTMISIAGVIGAGLFIGSGTAIATAGPAVLLSYAMAGLLVVLVMRMLGEMATAHPDTGSFSTYADRSLGKWAGFSIGWLYWWFWVLVIPLEATAGAGILTGWFPAVPRWVFALVITALLVGTNLLSVGSYGEFEFWFAIIKVVAIIAFILVGLAAILGLLPGSRTSGVGHLTSEGFMPYGFGAVLAALLTTMFTFMGTEIVTIAAAESDDPQGGIHKAVNSVIWRISLFYLGSIFVVVALVNHTDKALGDKAVGSYAHTLNQMNLHWGAQVLNFVILTAVASCLNSALYTASRMAFSLSTRGDAPKGWSTTTRRGVPAQAIIASSVVGFIAVIGNYLLPEKIFKYLISSSGAIALFVYLVIALSQLQMRRRLDAAGEKPPVRMWLFPFLTIATIVFIVAVIVLMAFNKEHRIELWLSLALAAVVVALGVLRQRMGTAPQRRAGATH